MKKTLKWSLVMMLAVFGLTFASCSDDDDETPTVPTVEEVVGDYSGKMTYAMAKATAEEGTTLDLKVANDSIIFEKFPYDALVEAIVGKENAGSIIELIGDKLEYKINYTAAMNAANDSVIITLKPEPLKIAAVAVEVIIETEKIASYAVKDKNLKFNLKAANVKIAGNDFPGSWNPINLAFDMKKK
nr:DUF4840 domain-containing protein [Parabacteroides goldsteinii]